MSSHPRRHNRRLAQNAMRRLPPALRDAAEANTGPSALALTLPPRDRAKVGPPPCITPFLPLPPSPPYTPPSLPSQSYPPSFPQPWLRAALSMYAWACQHATRAVRGGAITTPLHHHLSSPLLFLGGGGRGRPRLGGRTVTIYIRLNQKKPQTNPPTTTKTSLFPPLT